MSETVAGEFVPRLVTGVEPIGEYKGSGFVEPMYLARRPDGQVVQLTALLYGLLVVIDGMSGANQLATRTSAAVGRYVSADNVAFLVERKLVPAGLVDGVVVETQVNESPSQEQYDILKLNAQQNLVAPRAVQHASRWLSAFFNPAVIAMFLFDLIAGDATILIYGGPLAAPTAHAVADPPLLLTVLGAAILSMIFHEFGHAAACRYGGARPGAIGMGLYLIWPAFFTDVTDSYRLSRTGRLRVDLGGVYFNAVVAVAAIVAFLLTHAAVFLPIIVIVHLEIFSQLVPTLRFDGHLILADLAGVPDLFDRIGPVLRNSFRSTEQARDRRVTELKRSARVLTTVWVFVTVPLIITEFALLIWFGPATISAFLESVRLQIHYLVLGAGHGDVFAVVAGAVSLVLAALPVAGTFLITLLLLRRMFKALWKVIYKEKLCSIE